MNHRSPTQAKQVAQHNKQITQHTCQGKQNMQTKSKPKPSLNMTPYIYIHRTKTEPIHQYVWHVQKKPLKHFETNPSQSDHPTKNKQNFRHICSVAESSIETPAKNPAPQTLRRRSRPLRLPAAEAGPAARRAEEGDG